MRRRILFASMAAVALAPGIVRAQQPERVRRIGFLYLKSVPASTRVAAFDEALRALGWTKGGNLQIDYHSPEANPERLRSAAREIVASNPELVVVQTTPATREVLAITRTTPVVFVHVSDPVGSGFAASFARPGGNATGFTDTEASEAGKCLQLLKEVAPSVKRAVLLFNPATAPGRGEFFYGPFEAAGPPLGVATLRAAVHDMHEIETALAALGAEPGGGLVVTAESFMGTHSAEIVTLANRFRVPAVYPSRHYVATGGLLSFGIDSPDLFRRAAGYVDRILKGAKPVDLPIQAPTKFELVINLKTAKALGLTVLPSLLARADELIE